MASEPEATIEDLINIRFPISFYGEGSTVTSIGEGLEPDLVAAPVVPTAADIGLRYAMMHDAGVLGWNGTTRTIERLKPLDSEMEVFRDWWNQLLDHAGYEGPRP